MSIPRIFGRISPAAATSTDVFASPTTGASFSVRITNEGVATATLKLSLSTNTATQQSTGKLISDTRTLLIGETLELTGLIIETGNFLVGESDIVGVTFMAYGLEV